MTTDIHKSYIKKYDDRGYLSRNINLFLKYVTYLQPEVSNLTVDYDDFVVSLFSCFLDENNAQKNRAKAYISNKFGLKIPNDGSLEWFCENEYPGLYYVPDVWKIWEAPNGDIILHWVEVNISSKTKEDKLSNISYLADFLAFYNIYILFTEEHIKLGHVTNLDMCWYYVLSIGRQQKMTSDIEYYELIKKHNEELNDFVYG